MIRPALLALCTAAALSLATPPTFAADSVPVGIIINPYAGDRAGAAVGDDAAAMAKGGLAEVIEAAGGEVVRQDTVALTTEDEQQYGRWNRFGLASGHLADQAAANYRQGLMNLGLYNNCSSLMGMLGGLRHGTQAPQRVALVWIDAHGDFC